MGYTRDDGIRGFESTAMMGANFPTTVHSASVTAFDRSATCGVGRKTAALPPLYEGVALEAVTVLLESPAAATIRFVYANYVIVFGLSSQRWR